MEVKLTKSSAGGIDPDRSDIFSIKFHLSNYLHFSIKNYFCDLRKNNFS